MQDSSEANTARAFRDPRQFAFVPVLEAEFEAILAELGALERESFEASPDSLSIAARGYDERGWRAYALFGADPRCAAHRARCPRTARACAAVPRMVNAGFSMFWPGTQLYPHRGELAGILRCHLPLIVPQGDLGLRSGADTRVWKPGKCLIFDDTIEHEAWNRTDSDRVVLIVTFEP
ncbi:MAG: aspartyl/asparaginyl beta-hydroxylase domain-containing protein [Planctomycetes bacterium]|nr:aspartyl/asparaginyl beta-hydroxylase domain-containing protein [Planctomycetota bacterium]